MPHLIGLFSNMRTAILILCLFSVNAHAHLMTAQKGTLNIVNGQAYVVLSLPISAFAVVDIDKDGSVDLREFNLSRESIVTKIVEEVTLNDAQHSRSLEGIMLSPTMPHDGSAQSISQLVVMGHFPLKNFSGALCFEVGLFGDLGSERSLEITANSREAKLRSEFVLTPAASSSLVFAQSQ